MTRSAAPMLKGTRLRPAQDTELLSPGIVINSASPSSPSSPSLEASRHLSRSNIDIPRCSGPDELKRQLPRKRSDSSTYEIDTIKHHQAFLSRSGGGGPRPPGARFPVSSVLIDWFLGAACTPA